MVATAFRFYAMKNYYVDFSPYYVYIDIIFDDGCYVAIIRDTNESKILKNNISEFSKRIAITCAFNLLEKVYPKARVLVYNFEKGEYEKGEEISLHNALNWDEVSSTFLMV